MPDKISTAKPRVGAGVSGTRTPLMEVPTVGAAAKVLKTHASVQAQPPAPAHKAPEAPEATPPLAKVEKKKKTLATPRPPSRFKAAVGGAFSRMRGAISATRPMRPIPSKLWLLAALLTSLSAGTLGYTLLWPAESSLQTVDVDEIDDLVSPASEPATPPVAVAELVVNTAPAVMADISSQPALPLPGAVPTAASAPAVPPAAAGPALAMTAPVATTPAVPAPAPVEPAAFQPGARTHVVGVWLEGTIEEISDDSVKSAAYDASQPRPR